MTNLYVAQEFDEGDNETGGVLWKFIQVGKQFANCYKW
jgi:hypothetical protein